MGRKHYLINLLAADRCNNGGKVPTPAEVKILYRKTVAELQEFIKAERKATEA